jgi:hypothetical protein
MKSRPGTPEAHPSRGRNSGVPAFAHFGFPSSCATAPADSAPPAAASYGNPAALLPKHPPSAVSGAASSIMTLSGQRVSRSLDENGCGDGGDDDSSDVLFKHPAHAMHGGAPPAWHGSRFDTHAGMRQVYGDEDEDEDGEEGEEEEEEEDAMQSPVRPHAPPSSAAAGACAATTLPPALPQLLRPTFQPMSTNAALGAAFPHTTPSLLARAFGGPSVNSLSSGAAAGAAGVRGSGASSSAAASAAAAAAAAVLMRQLCPLPMTSATAPTALCAPLVRPATTPAAAAAGPKTAGATLARSAFRAARNEWLLRLTTTAGFFQPCTHCNGTGRAGGWREGKILC